jgi:hypothetical protein
MRLLSITARPEFVHPYELAVLIGCTALTTAALIDCTALTTSINRLYRAHHSFVFFLALLRFQAGRALNLPCESMRVGTGVS